MSGFFPTVYTYMRKFNLHQGGRKSSVCHSCWCWGFMSTSKHPGSPPASHLGRGCFTRGQLLPEMQHTLLKALCLADAAGLGLRPNPSLSYPRVLLEELKFLCLWADNISGPRARGYKAFCFFSRGQVEFSLTSYPCHLCLSLQINSITLNPQTEQRELVLFKGNIKSL